MKTDKLTMKVNYVKVVDELLQKRCVVTAEDGHAEVFEDVVREVIHKHWRPYTSSDEDKEDFQREMRDRGV